MEPLISKKNIPHYHHPSSCLWTLSHICKMCLPILPVSLPYSSIQGCCLNRSSDLIEQQHAPIFSSLRAVQPANTPRPTSGCSTVVRMTLIDSITYSNGNGACSSTLCKRFRPTAVQRCTGVLEQPPVHLRNPRGVLLTSFIFSACIASISYISILCIW